MIPGPPGQHHRMTEAHDPLADDQAREAAREAGAVGGPRTDDGLSEAQRPVSEGGGGEAEGFELAEADLVDRAENFGEPGHNPAPRAMHEEAEPNPSTYGEADSEHHED